METPREQSLAAAADVTLDPVEDGHTASLLEDQSHVLEM